MNMDKFLTILLTPVTNQIKILPQVTISVFFFTTIVYAGVGLFTTSQ